MQIHRLIFMIDQNGRLGPSETGQFGHAIVRITNESRRCILLQVSYRFKPSDSIIAR